MWICFFLEKTEKPEKRVEEPIDGYFFFDEDTGEIHKI